MSQDASDVVSSRLAGENKAQVFLDSLVSPKAPLPLGDELFGAIGPIVSADDVETLRGFCGALQKRLERIRG